jgi:hypothetical protein
MFKIVALSLFCIMIGCKSIFWAKPPTKITTTYIEPSGEKIKKLLLLGIGDTRSRIFFEDLAVAITSEFANAAILTESLFAAESAELDTIDYNNYDALLIFSGKKDMKILSEMTPKFVTRGGTVTDFGMTNKIKGSLGLLLYKQQNATIGLVWKGELAVDVLMTSKQEYREVGRLIYTELQKKKVIIK